MSSTEAAYIAGPCQPPGGGERGTKLGNFRV